MMQRDPNADQSAEDDNGVEQDAGSAHGDGEPFEQFRLEFRRGDPGGV
jgi:hypothetical protein